MSDNPRIDDLRRRVHKDPASIAFAQLAEEHRRIGQCEEAVQVCRSGLAIHPGYLSARVTLGRALIELGQLEAAQHELQMVLVSAPDNLAAIRGLAEILHRRGALAEALVHYQRALGLARNDPDLEQTVAELTREVARAAVRAPAPAVTTAAAAELLTLDELTQELKAHAPGPAPSHAAPLAVSAPVVVAVPAPASASATVSEPATDSAPAPVSVPAAVPATPDANAPSRDKDLRTIAALGQWLTAIDGFRAARRS